MNGILSLLWAPGSLCHLHQVCPAPPWGQDHRYWSLWSTVAGSPRSDMTVVFSVCDIPKGVSQVLDPPLIVIVWIQLRLVGLNMLSKCLHLVHFGPKLSINKLQLAILENFPTAHTYKWLTMFCRAWGFTQLLDHLNYFLTYQLTVLGTWKAVTRPCFPAHAKIAMHRPSRQPKSFQKLPCYRCFCPLLRLLRCCIGTPSNVIMWIQLRLVGLTILSVSLLLHFLTWNGPKLGPK